MAVTDVSGTAGLRAQLKNLAGREPGSIRWGWGWPGGHGRSDYKRPLLQGERLGVYFLIKSGLTRLAEASYPSYCTHRWIFLSSMQTVNHSSQQGLDIKKARTAQPTSFQTTVRIYSSISGQVSQILYQESTLSWWRSLTPPMTLETG